MKNDHKPARGKTRQIRTILRVFPEHGRLLAHRLKTTHFRFLGNKRATKISVMANHSAAAHEGVNVSGEVLTFVEGNPVTRGP